MESTHVVVSTQTVGDVEAEPFFEGLWEGYRNDWDGEFGGRILAEATFVITSLGRYVTSEHGLEEETVVTWWAADSQMKLAEVTVGPDSAVLDGYAYTEVFPRVVARRGREYRLTQTCHRSMRDPWPDGHYAEHALQSKTQGFARYLGGAYDCHGGFPSFCDAELGRRAGMLNFKAIRGIATIPVHPEMTIYELKLQLESATGVPPIQQELAFNSRPLSLNSATIDSEGISSGELLVLAVRAGSLAVTASRDGTARLWSVESGECLRILVGHSDAVVDVDFAPSGSTVLTASKDGTACIWTVETGERAAKLEGHTGPVLHAAFAPSGAQVVTASQDHTARVWMVDRTCKQVLNRHLGAVVNANFSPDGSRIITASTDCTARIWDPTFGDCLLTVKGHGGGVVVAKISPDSSQILTAAIDSQGVVIHDATGATLQKLADGQLVHDAAFSPDGCHIMAACCDWKARIWSAATFQCLHELEHAGQVLSSAFSADGSFAVTLCANHTALVWRVFTGELVHSFAGHSGPVITASFSPDSTRLVTGSEDGCGRVWDVLPASLSEFFMGGLSSKDPSKDRMQDDAGCLYYVP